MSESDYIQIMGVKLRRYPAPATPEQERQARLFILNNIYEEMLQLVPPDFVAGRFNIEQLEEGIEALRRIEGNASYSAGQQLSICTVHLAYQYCKKSLEEPENSVWKEKADKSLTQAKEFINLLQPSISTPDFDEVFPQFLGDMTEIVDTEKDIKVIMYKWYERIALTKLNIQSACSNTLLEMQKNLPPRSNEAATLSRAFNQYQDVACELVETRRGSPEYLVNTAELRALKYTISHLSRQHLPEKAPKIDSLVELVERAALARMPCSDTRQSLIYNLHR